MRRASQIFALLVLAACGGSPTGSTETSDGGPVDAGPVDAGPPEMYPAITVDSPQVVNVAGGPVLVSPRIVPIFFMNDDAATVASITDFVQQVGATSYWTATTQEYGIGAATATTAVMVAESPSGTITDPQIQTWLAGKLDSNDPTFPVADANTVYAIHYPAGVTVTQPISNTQSYQSCRDFGGYHSSTPLDIAHSGANVAYAVIPRCSSFGGLNGIDAITGAESHELLEASTDPYPLVNPAFSSVDTNHSYWGLAGSEVGDMCAQNPSAFTKFPGLPYTVQRTWSNVSARAGHDPCVPTLSGEVFFNAAPVMSDTIQYIDSMLQTDQIPGVSITLGDSKTIPLTLFSDAPTGAWQIQALDLNQITGAGPALLKFGLSQVQGNNGTRIDLTIETSTAHPFNTEVFLIASVSAAGQNYWLGIVGAK